MHFWCTLYITQALLNNSIVDQCLSVFLCTLQQKARRCEEIKDFDDYDGFVGQFCLFLLWHSSAFFTHRPERDAEIRNDENKENRNVYVSKG